MKSNPNSSKPHMYDRKPAPLCPTPLLPKPFINRQRSQDIRAVANSPLAAQTQPPWRCLGAPSAARCALPQTHARAGSSARWPRHQRRPGEAARTTGWSRRPASGFQASTRRPAASGTGCPTRCPAADRCAAPAHPPVFAALSRKSTSQSPTRQQPRPGPVSPRPRAACLDWTPAAAAR